MITTSRALMIGTSHNSRRLLPLFLATTLVPAACLGWLGWRVVEEDRRQQQDRIHEQREQAADLEASALQRVLAEAEERLVSFSTAPTSPPQVAMDGLTLVTFGQEGVLEHAGTPLLYYPALPKSPETEPARFAAIDELEFQKRDLLGALRLLEAMANDVDPVSIAEILLRSARIHRKLGNNPGALDVFTRLGKLDDVRVKGVPTTLLARQGRALIFESSGRSNDLQREAAAIYDDLENGHWMLTRGDFTNTHDQAVQWLTTPRPPIDPGRLALADASASLWRECRCPEIKRGTAGVAERSRLGILQSFC
jgi:hypothetical protein